MAFPPDVSDQQGYFNGLLGLTNVLLSVKHVGWHVPPGMQQLFIFQPQGVNCQPRSSISCIVCLDHAANAQPRH